MGITTALTMSADMVNILHREFADFTGSAFKVLYSESDFTDVTLVCNEGKQVKAHKVILRSSSIFFRRILLANPHQNPLIYLKGVEYLDLQSIVQFIYLGQIEIPQEALEKFIDTDKELEINGLLDLKHETDDQTTDPIYPKFTELICETDFSNIENTDETVILETEDNSTFLIKELSSETEKRSEQPINYDCEKCQECFAGKNKLMKHRRTVHEGLAYPLNNADRAKLYRERRKSILPEDDIKEINKEVYKKKFAVHKARRIEDKEFDEQELQKNRERVRRFREKKALEEAITLKMF